MCTTMGLCNERAVITCFTPVLHRGGDACTTLRLHSLIPRVTPCQRASCCSSMLPGDLLACLHSTAHCHGVCLLYCWISCPTDRTLLSLSPQGVLPAVLPDQLPQLLACVSPFESAYRSACLGRMSDAVATAFPGGSRSLPSPADVQKCIG